MWFWWMSYDKIREIDREILGLREELKAVYTKLKDLIALRRYHQSVIDLRTRAVFDDYEEVATHVAR